MTTQFSLASIPNYVVPRVQTFYAHASKYYNTASPVVDWIDKRVMVLTEVLPKPGALLTYHLWKSTPYIAASIVLSHSLFIVAVVAAVGYYFFTTPADKSPDLSPVLNGVGFSYVICGIGFFFGGAVTHTAILTITGLFQMVVGGGCLYSSGFANRFILTCKGQACTIPSAAAQSAPSQSAPSQSAPSQSEEAQRRVVQTGSPFNRGSHRRIPLVTSSVDSDLEQPSSILEQDHHDEQDHHKKERSHKSLVDRLQDKALKFATERLLQIPLGNVSTYIKP